MRTRRDGDDPQPRIEPLENSRQALETERLDYVRQEFELAQTFLEVAEAATNDEIRMRNLSHAQLAYDSVLQLLRLTELTPAGRAYLEPDLRRLRDWMDRLRTGSAL